MVLGTAEILHSSTSILLLLVEFTCLGTNNIEMKIFLIVSCLLATAAAISTENLNKISEAWKVPIEKCSKEYGINVSTLQDIFEQQQKGEISNDSCVHACILRSAGVLTFWGLNGRRLNEYANSIFAGQPEVATMVGRAAIGCIDDVSRNMGDECKRANLYAQCLLNSN